MPFIDINGLDRFLGKIKALIDEKIANISPTPWKYKYKAVGDILGMERNVSAYTATKKLLPYKVTATVELADKAKAYNDATNEEYATMATSTDERTMKMLIDTQMPTGATISNMSIAFKVGSNNISPSKWTKRTYTVKCGGNILGSGTLVLKTMGNVFTIPVTDMSLIVSPIIEIAVTVQTTEELSVRVFGAEVSTTFTATREWVTVMRQNQLANN